MAIEQINSNSNDFAAQIPAADKKIVLRKGTADDPVSWDQMDNNLELLRAKLNELIQKVNELDNG
jgi:hypothetical protein